MQRGGQAIRRDHVEPAPGKITIPAFIAAPPRLAVASITAASPVMST